MRILLPIVLSMLMSHSVQAQSKTSTGKTAKPRGLPKVTVMIDPGHGGEDDGAFHFDVKEKNVALKVALELKQLLLKDGRFVPTLTRETDVFVPLDDRSRLAEEQKADVFISIHANSNNSKRVRGTEFYFENQIATDEESLFLANRENSSRQDPSSTPGPTGHNPDLANILSDLARTDHLVMSQQLSQHLLESFQKTLNVKTRALRQAPFRVLSVTMPATLIELGFLSNETEAKWLNDATTQQMLARSIYDGIRAFKEKLDKNRVSPVK
jgi:N-acetylmuramoyl-L-alanine amidase